MKPFPSHTNPVKALLAYVEPCTKVAVAAAVVWGGEDKDEEINKLDVIAEARYDKLFNNICKQETHGA